MGRRARTNKRRIPDDREQTEGKRAVEGAAVCLLLMLESNLLRR